MDGLAWAGCVTVVVAESGAGKTFLLLGVAAAVADGTPWHGRATQRGSVAYVSFEGDALGLRLQALRDAGYSLRDVHVRRAFDPLSPRIGRDGVESASPGEESLAKAIAALSAKIAAEDRPPIGLLIIDTVRASLAGSEDKSDDVAAYLRAVRRLLAQVPTAAAILAHHSGWMDGKDSRRRERGSSTFRGNVDCTLYLEVDKDDPANDLENHCSYLTLSALKVRDGPRPAPLRLVRRQVKVLSTDAADVATSCLIELDDPRKQEERVTKAQARRTTAAEAEQREFDHKVLCIIHEHKPTSIEKIRALSGGDRNKIIATTQRLFEKKLIDRSAQRQPYTLTAGGRKEIGVSVNRRKARSTKTNAKGAE
jgi:RecA-family ATPase